MLQMKKGDHSYIIGSDNGLSPGRRQAIIWTNAGILQPVPSQWAILCWFVVILNTKLLRLSLNMRIHVEQVE